VGVPAIALIALRAASILDRQIGARFTEVLRRLSFSTGLLLLILLVLLVFLPYGTSLPGTCSVRVVRYPPDVELTYAQLERQVLENLPGQRPITLIAESFSGPIALRLANDPDLNIRAVVLVCSFGSRPLGKLGAVLAHLPISSLLRFRAPELLLRTVLLGKAAPDELVAATVAAISSVRPSVLAGRLKAALTSHSMSGPVAPSTRVIAIFSSRDQWAVHVCIQGRLAIE
jgi:pimeloyl-ACP methyl ester carboxylesterase